MIERRDFERGRKGGGGGCFGVMCFVAVEGGSARCLIWDRNCGIELNGNGVIWVEREWRRERRKVEKKGNR